MKKIMISALLASTLVSGADYSYELSPMAGYAFPNDAQDLNNHGVYGAELQFNDFGAIKPELSVLYSDANYENGGGDTDIFRSALNGVYELSKSNGVTPFVKAGLGYETMSNHQFDNHNSLFADAGAGVKVALAEQIALKLEAIDMVKFNDFNWDNNFLMMAGLSFALGEKVKPAPAPVAEAPKAQPAPAPKPAPKPVIAAPVDSDKDGVFDPQDKCPNSPAGFKVDANGCNIDSDKDGVLDPADKCPDTPAGFKVDADGCPLSATLHLNFAFDSNKIVDADSTAKVTNFANFMKDSPAYKATITGHTDSIGKEDYNQKLSEKRAETVKSMLVEQGVAADRLSAFGKGETSPVASNKTKEGRAENRRIEVELTR